MYFLRIEIATLLILMLLIVLLYHVCTSIFKVMMKPSTFYSKDPQPLSPSRQYKEEKSDKNDKIGENDEEKTQYETCCSESPLKVVDDAGKNGENNGKYGESNGKNGNNREKPAVLHLAPSLEEQDECITHENVKPLRSQSQSNSPTRKQSDLGETFPLLIEATMERQGLPKASSL